MDIYEAIRMRTSVRAYRSDPVEEDKLERILDAARLAPSGKNGQPWRFIVIQDEKTRQDLVPACKNQSFIAEADWGRVLRERMLDIYANRCYRGPWFRKKRWSRERVKEWLRKEIDRVQERYMDAREAVEYGFMDAVLGDKGYATVESLGR